MVGSLRYCGPKQGYGEKAPGKAGASDFIYVRLSKVRLAKFKIPGWPY